jgi:hypothetical protein
MPRKLTHEQINEIIKLKNQGLNDREIAKRVKCSTTTVAKYKFAGALATRNPSLSGAIDVFEKKETFNLLDVARDMPEMVELGVQGGAFVGSLASDFVDAFDRDIPPVKRIAKAFRAFGTIGTMVAAGYEWYSQLQERKRIAKENIERGKEISHKEP